MDPHLSVTKAFITFSGVVYGQSISYPELGALLPPPLPVCLPQVDKMLADYPIRFAHRKGCGLRFPTTPNGQARDETQNRATMKA